MFRKNVNCLSGIEKQWIINMFKILGCYGNAIIICVGC